MVSQLLHSWGREGFLQHIDRYVPSSDYRRTATTALPDWFDWSLVVISVQDK